MLKKGEAVQLYLLICPKMELDIRSGYQSTFENGKGDDIIRKESHYTQCVNIRNFFIVMLLVM